MLRKTHKFTLMINPEEKKRLSAWGKKHGFSSLSKLFFASLDVVQRNPNLLEPTESNDIAKVYEVIQESYSSFELFLQYLQTIQFKVETLERAVDWLMEKQGVTEKELKKIYQEDETGDAIFETEV